MVFLTWMCVHLISVDCCPPTLPLVRVPAKRSGPGSEGGTEVRLSGPETPFAFEF